MRGLIAWPACNYMHCRGQGYPKDCSILNFLTCLPVLDTPEGTGVAVLGPFCFLFPFVLMEFCSGNPRLWHHRNPHMSVCYAEWVKEGAGEIVGYHVIHQICQNMYINQIVCVM